MNLSSIAAVSLAIAGLLAIPFMANSVTSNAISNYDEGISAVFNSTPDNFSATQARKFPGTVEEQLSPDEYSFSTSTAFGMFRFRTTSTGMEMGLSRTGEEITMKSSNNGTVEETWVLRTPTFILASVKRFDRAEERYEVPEGYCIRTVERGSVREECFGHVGRIDDRWQKARERMRELAGRLRQVAESLEIPNPDSVQWKYS